ncbi:hypothetical protein C8046_12365 [Serinibacter arcticus]|uniref:Uncharacterized protein n=1 Tax=Serinibacter arcticus TaxID=1655435 RepID=A0A2U1ZWH0_9MICO|nr:hypothetical protein C8046_12365 [Serinibacter arcticus]
MLIAAALGAGRVREVALPDRDGLVVADGDLARLSSATANAVGGVLSASTVADPRRLTVTLSTTGADRTPGDVEGAVTAALGGLGLARQVRVVSRTPAAAPSSRPAPSTTAPTTTQEVHHA